MLLYWAAVFFIIALAAGILGFTSIARESSAVARILFFVFIILFLISAIMGTGYFA
ncbi:MAG: DUF1328 domain-containing protein [Candidatus Babeliaceae bacterium]|jgi:uncharacterized membrane protein YtjA (UPF0391 family)